MPGEGHEISRVELHVHLAKRNNEHGTFDEPRAVDCFLFPASSFPFIFGRVEHGFYHMGSVQVKVERPFKEYLRRFHYDYLNYYPEALRFLIHEVGSDRVVIGTDLFAARDIQYPNSVVEQLKLPAADLDRIIRGNAKRLLHL